MKFLIVEPIRNDIKIRGIIMYYHGTLFDKAAVPTNLSDLYRGLGALYAAREYIVLIPDYIGLGKDFINSHPYVMYPQQIIRSSIIALNKYLPRLIEKFKIITINVSSVGYSEGGSYSLWLLKCT
jgi:hypothetical protein